ncbi:MAG: GNAT family N-acetyltransferase [Chromatiales bacterium]|jgi:tRNA(Met) cytidine acetyltransferase
MRHLLVITGESHWCSEQAHSFLENREGTLWLTNSIDEPDAIPASKARQFLGREFNAVVFDMHTGLDPDALGAISGTIRDGGCLLLLAPPLETWTAFRDPWYARIDSWPPHDGDFPGHYLGFLQRLIVPGPGLHLVSRDNPELPGIAEPACTTPRSTGDQLEAIAAIRHVATGHARRPLVITADRGRGKSAALGFATGELLKTGHKRILLTAPSRSAVDPVFRHALETLPGAVMAREGLLEHENGRLEFLPPDEMAHRTPPADLLLVDEAAAIPATLLKKLLLAFNRIVFSTTVHGYEGTGRGFAIRFREILDNLRPQWRDLRLHEPIRWQAGDPLEAFIARALLLSAEPAGPEQFASTGADAIELVETSQAELCHDPALLAQVFGLLVNAHYQTRPFDLRYMLDGRNMRILLAKQQDNIAGVLLSVCEGAFGDQLAEEILSGKRRPQGNLAPQSLALHLQEKGYLECRYERILRIAVHPDLQGSGIGSRMLKWLGSKSDVDLLATSFGATAELLRFWKSCGFIEARMGLGRDAASGSHSLLMLHPLTGRGRVLQQQAFDRFHELLFFLLPTSLNGLESDLVCDLLHVPGRSRNPLDGTARHRLHRFVSPGLPQDTILPELDALVRSCGSSGRLHLLSPVHRELLVALVLQKRGSRELVDMLPVDGKRKLEMLLREAVGELLEVCVTSEEISH